MENNRSLIPDNKSSHARGSNRPARSFIVFGVWYFGINTLMFCCLQPHNNNNNAAQGQLVTNVSHTTWTRAL